MFNYEMTKENTNAKIKATAKLDVTTLIIDFLKEQFGDGNVAMIRTGNSSKTNEIGCRIGTVNIGGDEVPITITLNPTVKEFEDRKTAKKEYFAFDFDAAVNEYEEYLDEKAEKASEAKKIKEANIERSEASRKKKTEPDVEDF